MILRTETVEQVIDEQRRVALVKDVVMTGGDHPLGMVRKRLPGRDRPRGVVLLVHGFGQNRYTWHIRGRSFSTFLAAEGFDVWNVDLRGHGRSRRFSDAWAGAMDDYVRDDMPACVEEALLHTGDTRVFFIGHSMGGIIGYCAAASSLRGRLRGLVTIGSPYHFGHGSLTLHAASLALGMLRSTGLFRRRRPLPLALVALGLRHSRFLWDRKLLTGVPLRPWSPGSIEDEVLEEYLGRAFDWTTLQVAFDLVRSGPDRKLRARDGTDYGAAFERETALPLLLVAGRRDALAPPASVRPAYARSASRDKSFRVFPLGHVDLIVGREAPMTTWPLISGWLSRR
jgi:pimeloyl-ACP methyl ester carboxylesterase